MHRLVTFSSVKITETREQRNRDIENGYYRQKVTSVFVICMCVCVGTRHSVHYMYIMQLLKVTGKRSISMHLQAHIHIMDLYHMKVSKNLRWIQKKICNWECIIDDCFFSVGAYVLSISVATVLRLMEEKRRRKWLNLSNTLTRSSIASMLKTSPVGCEQETHSSHHTILIVNSD